MNPRTLIPTSILSAALGAGIVLAAQTKPEPPAAEVNGYKILRVLVRERTEIREQKRSHEPGTDAYDRLEAREALLSQLLTRLVDSPAARERLGLAYDDGQRDSAEKPQ